jgi:hypothetical protein
MQRATLSKLQIQSFQSPPWNRLWLTLICLALIACGSGVPFEPTAPASRVSPTSSPQPSPSPTPSLDLWISDTYWVEFPNPGEWSLVGTVINREPYQVEDIQLNLQLNDSSPSGHLALKTSAIPAQLQPSGEALIQFHLPDGSLPSEYRLNISAIRSGPGSPSEQSIDLIQLRETQDGRLMISGEIENRGDHLLHLYSVHLLLLDDQDIPLGVAESQHLLPALAPNDSSPFSASVDVFIEAYSWKAFFVARPELMPPLPPLEIVGELSTEMTSQGQPFYLGQIENRGVTPWRLVLNIVYLLEGDVIALDTLVLPFPLPPRDRTAFMIDPSRSLEPEHLSKADLAQVEVQMSMDPWRTLPIIAEPVMMPVTLTQFEPIGSQLYLQGTVTNTHYTTLGNTSILFTIYDVRGRTRAVGWSELFGELDVGEAQSFNINLLIPKDLNINLTEFDVRAVGFPPE